MRSGSVRSLQNLPWVCDSCQSSLRRGRVTALKITRRPSSSSKSRETARRRLPDTPARTRFAPSPTGNLHLGSVRTALFNYLLARKTKGQFLLRLEDTDQKRTVPGAEEKLYRDLQWAGLQWDEGPVVGGPFGPYRQSERLSHYHRHIKGLVDSQHAYRCFCTPERLDELNRRRHDLGLAAGYDRKCASIDRTEAEQRAAAGEKHIIRFRAPDIWPRFMDLVYGNQGHGLKSKKSLSDAPVWDDTVLVKSDGFPTYHWANVCDDHDMEITHVIRGTEWMSSTPLHVAMYDAKGWTPPLFAHVPLLVGLEGRKLSKRDHDTDISSYETRGISRDALTNFAALLGWSHQKKNDVMDLGELEEAFDLKITKGNTIVDFGKLRFLQAQHARRQIIAGGEPFEQMIRDVAVALLEKYGAAKVMALVGRRKLRDVVASMLRAESLAFHSVEEFVQDCSIFLEAPRPSKADLLQPQEKAKDLSILASTLMLVPESQWTAQVHAENQKAIVLPKDDKSVSKHNNAWKASKKNLYHYLRWALLGGAPGPSIPQTMEILGKAICVDRIERAVRETRTVFQTEQNATTRPEISPTPLKAAAWPPVSDQPQG